MREGSVQLKSGRKSEYEFLAVATGSWQLSPSKYAVLEKRDGVAALKATQKAVLGARSVAIVGGGAVGVQMASDIKSYFPGKEVTLVHSRANVLHSFGPRLQGVAMEALAKMDVGVLTGEKPAVKSDIVDGLGSGSLLFSDGKQKRFDLVLPCTGQRPNSAILSRLLPSAINPQTRQILVQPTLQIREECSNSTLTRRIFSLGDVAKTGGPRFARAARAQAEVVTTNILALIRGQPESMTEYRAALYEGAIKLTLGKDKWVFCGRLDDGREVMKFGKSGNGDMEIASAWAELGVQKGKEPVGSGLKDEAWSGGNSDGAAFGVRERMEKHQERFNAAWGAA